MGPGLYIHVPFCARRCPYCDFYAEVAGDATKDRAVRAIVREAEMRLPSWTGGAFDSVFLGGGTPSALGPRRLTALARGIRERAPIAANAEWTLEANPDSATAPFLETALESGFNRLSLGIQSFGDAELALLGRLHDAGRAKAAIADARRAGFRNLSIDLIYGLPGSDGGRGFRRSLETAVSLGPEHLSCYLLTLEPGVAMERPVKEGALRLPSDAAQRRQYDAACLVLEEAGYEHYEISKWARPGFRCRHNEGVWSGGDYLGLGPAAHGHLNGVRAANSADLGTYLLSLEAGRLPPREEEAVDAKRRADERLLLGLRLRDGLAWRDLAREFGHAWAGALKGKIGAFTEAGLVEDDGERLRLGQRGLFVSNRVIAALLEAA